MPTYEFTCEVCGTLKKAWRGDGDPPPRFCSRKCRTDGLVDCKKETKWILTPEMKAEIVGVYKTKTESGEVKELAKKLGIPRWKIGRYAASEGLIPIRRKEPDWTEPELKILEGSARHTPERIQKVLKKAGYSRSIMGIVLKRRRMRYLSNLSGHTSRNVAQCFGIDDHCIIRWINLGYMKAIKRGTKRTAAQGGDQWYIKDKWIRDFVMNYLDEVDIRKVDKYWFVDLLVGGDHYGMGACKAKEDDQRETDADGGLEDCDVDPEVREIFAEASAGWA